MSQKGLDGFKDQPVKVRNSSDYSGVGDGVGRVAQVAGMADVLSS